MPASHHADLAESDGPTLMTYLGWLRRRWWILVLLAVIGASSGLVINQMQQRTYTSSTKVLVRQIGPDANPNAKVNLDTEAQVVRSLVVAQRAVALMKTSTAPETLLSTLSVSVPPNSQVMEIAFEATTPKLAQSGSHAFAQAYLDLRVATANKNLDNEVTALNKQIAEASKQLASAAAKVGASQQNSVQREQAEAERAVAQNTLTQLKAKLTPLQATSLDPGEIISDARLPTEPSSPNRTLNLASGLAAGLLFGLVLALVLDRLDTRVRRGRDISDRLGVEVLLEVPDRVTSLSVLPPTHQISREIGRLRNVLLTNVPAPAEGRGRQILLTDASPSSAAGFVAGNLAAAYARTGQQVALLTTKSDSPLSAMMAGTDARYTLADVLRRDVTALKALAPIPGLTQLRVLLPGNLDAEVELPVAAILEVLAELSARFDHVVVESASPIVAVEAQALANHVDAVIIVAESGRTRSGEITGVLHQFEQVDAPVIGAVLTPRMHVSGRGRPGGPVSRSSINQVERKRIPSIPVGKPGGEARPRLVLPQGPAESTVVLPRMNQQAKPTAPARSDHANGSATQSKNQSPGKGGGKSTTYKSSRAGDSGRSVAMDPGEGFE